MSILFLSQSNIEWWSQAFKIGPAEVYLQISLDEKSAELMVINTHQGLYKFK